MDTTMSKITIYKLDWGDSKESYIGSTVNLQNTIRILKKREKIPSVKTKMIEMAVKDKNFTWTVLAEVTGSKAKLQRVKQEWIDRLKPSLNVARVYTDDIEREKHLKAYRRKYDRDHRKERTAYMNRWFQKSIVQCHCGGQYRNATKTFRTQHFNTQKHKRFKNSIASGSRMLTNRPRWKKTDKGWVNLAEKKE